MYLCIFYFSPCSCSPTITMNIMDENNQLKYKLTCKWDFCVPAHANHFYDKYN